MKYIRKILGALVVFFDALTRPKPIERSVDAQSDVDGRSKNLSLYQFHACPFCVKVRRTLHKLNVNIELHDAKTDKIGNELLKEGGKRKVPCLRIEKDGKVQWMYNSKDIIVYLQNSFA
ncbi:MAG: glutathione S-transferase N-terminal domain-containing protein [Proteobacteria bacterium]|nr:glutathione S-transferase N-terminal domain-containing protein [Pseudomonadota bacterium]